MCVLSLHDAQTWATHGRTRTDKRVGVSSGRVCHACGRVTPVCVCVGVCHKRHECQPTQDMERVTDKRHLDTDRAAEEERRSRRSLAPCPECSSGAPCVSPGKAHIEKDGHGERVKEPGMEGESSKREWRGAKGGISGRRGIGGRAAGDRREPS